ncbi:hypothetical protein L218DRAFT_804460, partial [Marasmius fiardii PR-910]
ELYDSGCSHHISPYQNLFTSFHDVSPCSFHAANKQKFSTSGTGNITVDVPNS